MDGKIEVEFVGRGEGVGKKSSTADLTPEKSESRADSLDLTSDDSKGDPLGADGSIDALHERDGSNDAAHEPDGSDDAAGRDSASESRGDATDFADRKNVTMTEPGERVQLPSGEFHRVHTLGKVRQLFLLRCLMY